MATISELQNTNFKRPKDLKGQLSKIQHCERLIAIQTLQYYLVHYLIGLHAWTERCMTEQYSDIVKFIKHKLRGGLA